MLFLPAKLRIRGDLYARPSPRAKCRRRVSRNAPSATYLRAAPTAGENTRFLAAFGAKPLVFHYQPFASARQTEMPAALCKNMRETAENGPERRTKNAPKVETNAVLVATNTL